LTNAIEAENSHADMLQKLQDELDAVKASTAETGDAQVNYSHDALYTADNSSQNSEICMRKSWPQERK